MINYIQQSEKNKKHELKQLKIGLMVIGYDVNFDLIHLVKL